MFCQPSVREQNSPQFTAERCSSSLPLGNVVQSTMYRANLFNVANSIFQIQLSGCKTLMQHAKPLRCLQQTIFFMNYSICHRFESDCPSVSGWYSSAGRAILFTHRVYDTDSKNNYENFTEFYCIVKKKSMQGGIFNEFSEKT